MPRDFRNKTFQKTLRGYAPDEVNEYIAYINEEYRKLERRFGSAAKKIDELTKSAQQAAEAEHSPADAVKEAEEKAEKILADAAAKAEAILKAAEEEAEQERNEAQKIRESALEYRLSEQKKADEYSAQAVKSAQEKALAICTRVTHFKDKLFDEYSSHIEQIESISAEADELARSFAAESSAPDENHEPDESAEASPRKGISSLTESLISASAEITAGENPDSDENGGDEPKEDLYIDLDRAFDGDSAAPDEEAAGADGIPADEAGEDYTFVEDEPQPDIKAPEDEPGADETPEEKPDSPDLPPTPPDETPAEPEIKDEDLIRKEQLDRFFGILNDDDLAPEPDESENSTETSPENLDGSFDDSAVIDEIINGVLSGDESATRELDLGELIRLNRKNSPATQKSTAPAAENPPKKEESSDFNEGGTDGDYIDVDSIISHGVVKQDLSLTDEFDIVFSDKNSRKSVEEIRRQPTIAPRAPSKNPKKIIKKHSK